MPVGVVYVETSVFGFYYDRLPVNREKRTATRELFRRFHLGILRGLLSPVTRRELEATEDGVLRRHLLSLAADLDPLGWNPAIDGEIADLAGLYIRRDAVPADKRDDAIHVAIAVVTREVDFMVSWNYRHLANVAARRRLRAVTLEAGYSMGFEIVTPMEVVSDD